MPAPDYLSCQHCPGQPPIVASTTVSLESPPFRWRLIQAIFSSPHAVSHRPPPHPAGRVGSILYPI